MIWSFGLKVAQVIYREENRCIEIQYSLLEKCLDIAPTQYCVWRAPAHVRQTIQQEQL